MGSECNSDNLLAFCLVPYPEPPPPSSSGMAESPSLFIPELVASSCSQNSASICFGSSRWIQKNKAARNNIRAAGILNPSIKPSFLSSLSWLSPSSSPSVVSRLLEVFWGAVAGIAVVGEGEGRVEMFVEGLLSGGRKFHEIVV